MLLSAHAPGPVSPPPRGLRPLGVIGLKLMRAGQSPSLTPQIELILFLVLWGTFIVGLWVVDISCARCEGFMWIPGLIAL